MPPSQLVPSPPILSTSAPIQLHSLDNNISQPTGEELIHQLSRSDTISSGIQKEFHTRKIAIRRSHMKGCLTINILYIYDFGASTINAMERISQLNNLFCQPSTRILRTQTSSNQTCCIIYTHCTNLCLLTQKIHKEIIVSRITAPKQRSLFI